MRNYQHIAWLALLLTLCISAVPQQALACAGACAIDADCSANPCRYCDTDFGICADCCEFTDAITCPAACTWQYGECRNVSGTTCGIGVPETPKNYRQVFFIVFTLTALGVTFWQLRRRKLI